MRLTSRGTIAARSLGLWGLLAVGAASWAPGLVALGQFDDNPVYVDDSPAAWELFRRARDHEQENPGEAARVYQELLDLHAHKLIPLREADRHHLASARIRVNAALLANPRVLERYRAIETSTARRMLEQGQYESLLRTRFLTEPALEAALRLAQDAVERAHFMRAVRALTELAAHPDLAGRRAAYRWLLLGLAANHLGDSTLRQQAVDALAGAADADSRACLDELNRLLRQGPGPEEARGLTVLDAAPSPDLAALGGTPIWSAELTESLFRRRFATLDLSGRGMGATVEATRLMGDLLTAAPTVAGRMVYVNEGHVIRAFDRFSQREFWSRKVGEGGVISPRGNRSVGDLNIVAVSGDRLVTITGHAGAQGRVGSAFIVCLDAVTGREHWRTGFDRLGSRDELAGLYPHGAPIIADGQVFVLARKSQGQLLMSTYLVALDLVSGSPRWSQYIASSGGLQQSESRPYSTPVYAGGEVFVASAFGAVACLEAGTGEVRWLRRLESPYRLSAGTLPWEMGGPAVTGRGVFVLTSDQRWVVHLDRLTGLELGRFAATDWGSPAYLLGAGEWVYAVGRNLNGIDALAPGVPLWTLNVSTPESIAYDIRGRVQVAGSMLIVPTDRGVLYVRGDSGEVLSTIDHRGAGNPLVVGAELFVAGSDRLDAYMPLAVAENMLRRQIEASPDDPEPALSLLRLARRVEDPAATVALAIEAADLAGAAIGRDVDARRRDRAQSDLFETLLEFARDHQELPYATGAPLHSRLAAAAANDAQRVEHLLARGDWLAILAQRDPVHLTEAIESFQSVLTDPTLAQAERTSGGVRRRASSDAAERLGALIARHGAAYAGLAREAESAFARIRQNASPGELIELARRYPFAEASREALLLAANRLREAGRPREALAALTTLYAASPTTTQARPVLGAMVTLCEQAGWRILAAHWVGLAERRHGLKELPGPDGAPRTHAAALDALLPDAAVDRLPSLRRIVADQAQELPVLPGRLVRTRSDVTAPTRYALMLGEGGVVSRVQGTPLSARWSAALGDPEMQLIAHDRRSILFVLPGTGGDLVRVDAETGETLWKTAELRASTARLGQRPRTGVGRFIDLPNGMRFDAQEPVPLPGAGDVIIIGRSGGARRFDLARPGVPIAWEGDHPLEQVHHALRHDLAVVLAGFDRDPRTGGIVGRIVLLDPDDGSVLRTLSTQDDELVRWMVLTPGGELVYGAGNGLAGVDLASGERLWTSDAPENRLLGRAWVMDDLVLAADSGARLVSIRARDGRMSRDFQPDSGPAWTARDLVNLHVVGGRILAHYQERLVWFLPDGTIDGQDVTPEERQYTDVLLADDRMLAISHVIIGRAGEFEVRSPGVTHVDVLYLFSRSNAILDKRFVESTREVLHGTALIDGWALLSSRNRTIAVSVE